MDVTQKRLMEELEPLSHTDATYVTTLYTKLATDKKIDAFLAKTESGYTTVDIPEEGENEGAAKGSKGDGGDQEEVERQGKRPRQGTKKGTSKKTSKSTASTGMWSQLPPAPVALERQIYPGLIKLLECILAYFYPTFPVGVDRTIVDASSTELNHLDHQTTRPDVVICAKGPSFEVPDRSKPNQSFESGSSAKTRLKDVGYTNAAAVIEVKRDGTSDTDWEMIAQLSMYCR